MLNKGLFNKATLPKQRIIENWLQLAANPETFYKKG